MALKITTKQQLSDDGLHRCTVCGCDDKKQCQLDGAEPCGWFAMSESGNGECSHCAARAMIETGVVRFLFSRKDGGLAPSHVTAIQWNAPDHTLRVYFGSTSREDGYDYHGATIEHAIAMVLAESPGRYHRRYIRGKFETVRLGDGRVTVPDA